MIVGITGGIGSGKTTVLKMFQKFGIDCYIADVEAKFIMNSSVIVKTKIIASFGEESYIDGALNRRYLASQVFANEKKLELLNSIVHPEVAKHFDEFVKHSNSEYIIYESAILFESKTFKKCDFIITVTAPIDIRIERILKRDNTTKIDVLNRMKNQISDEKKIEKSDFVIQNIDLIETEKNVEEIHTKLLSFL